MVGGKAAVYANILFSLSSKGGDVSSSEALAVVDSRNMLGENALWCPREQVLWWFDVVSVVLWRFTPATGRVDQWPLPKRAGSFALRAARGLLFAFQKGFATLEEAGGEFIWRDVAGIAFGDERFNDGKVDRAGRFWAGTMPISGSGPHGSLYLVGKEGSLHRMVTGVTISNGLAWSLDRKKMYYIDTPTFEVACFDYDDTTGSIDRRRTAFKIPRTEGAPDGMTIDAEGMLWVAHWGGWQVTRWDPEKGTKIDQIKLPVSNVTSCTFGGSDLRDLYITSAREGLTAAQLLAGALFVIRQSDWKGLPVTRCSGV